MYWQFSLSRYTYGAFKYAEFDLLEKFIVRVYLYNVCSSAYVIKVVNKISCLIYHKVYKTIS